MSTWVLDASVAAKWMLPPVDEELVDSAVELLDEYVRGDVELVVPDIFWAECGSILWKAVRGQRCSKGDAEMALDRVLAYGFTTVSSAGLIVRALRVALQSGRTVYDCLYLALAEAYGIQLVTADQRLVNAVGNDFPVKWLGSL